MESIESVKSDQNVSRKDFWHGQLLRAKEFSGSGAEFCRQNNLNVATFYNYKKRLSADSKVAGSKKFVQVVSKPEKTRPSERDSPDPKWLAEFVLHIMKSK